MLYLHSFETEMLSPSSTIPLLPLSNSFLWLKRKVNQKQDNKQNKTKKQNTQKPKKQAKY